MTLRRLLVLEFLFLLAGGLATQAYGASCAEARRIRIVYWNDINTGHSAAAADLRRQNEWAFRGTCGSWAMTGYGDYDHDHHWHDSDWWVGHDRDWVQHHHPDWARSEGHPEEHAEEHHEEHPEAHAQEHHEKGPGPAGNAGHDHDHDHDHDHH